MNFYTMILKEFQFQFDLKFRYIFLSSFSLAPWFFFNRGGSDWSVLVIPGESEGGTKKVWKIRLFFLYL